MKKSFLLSLAALCMLCISCTREIEDLEVTGTANEYYPLQKGKYITYRLDSTVFTQQGRNEELHSYQEKQQVTEEMLDNAGRKSYIVQRFLRNAEGTSAWEPSGNFYVTVDNQKVEVVEHNLRFIKLVFPIFNNTTWKGNSYLPSNPYSPQYSFDLGNQLSLWDYQYTGKDETLQLQGKTYQNVLTMTAVEDSIPVTNEQVYAYKTISIDKYAKNTGLIYQRYAIWEYQKNIGYTPYKIGFEVKRTIIDHN